MLPHNVVIGIMKMGNLLKKVLFPKHCIEPLNTLLPPLQLAYAHKCVRTAPTRRSCVLSGQRFQSDCVGFFFPLLIKMVSTKVLRK